MAHVVLYTGLAFFALYGRRFDDDGLPGGCLGGYRTDNGEEGKQEEVYFFHM
jgi:hypothetical protein